MNNLDSIDLVLKEKIESGEFTPETLAWTLITDDDCEKIKNGKLIFFDVIEGLTLEEQIENKFQILLTVYFEMLFGWYKLLHLMKDEMDGTNTEFKPDLSSITLDDLTKEFLEKFKILGYILHVRELTDDEYNEYEREISYCRVLLKDSELDSNYFHLKRYQLDPEKRYTFVRNGKFQLKNIIKKYTAIVKLSTKSFKIYFDLIDLTDLSL
jgi:hypothetical protein